MRTFISDSLTNDINSYLCSFPRAVYECENCKNEIFEGQRCFEIDGAVYCTDCVTERTAGEDRE